MLTKCRICHKTDENSIYVAREMRFGTKEEFEYFKCSYCNCLQIETIPENLEKFYPEGYYSFSKVKRTKDVFIKKYLKKLFTQHFLGDEQSIIGKSLLKIFDPGFLSIIKGTMINTNSSILDVGSGAGERLNSLSRYGFSNLTGIDPYIEKDLFYDNGVKIFKSDIFNWQESYDMVMLNHSFEHMPDPDKVLFEVKRLLKPKKIALIRIPVADSYAWKKYGVNWVALDPPRHLHLHTEKSIRILSENVGLELIDIIYDSIAIQFWGSEQYSKDIPLQCENSYYENPQKSIFSISDIKKFEEKAIELNINKEGDTACFYLQNK